MKDSMAEVLCVKRKVEQDEPKVGGIKEIIPVLLRHGVSFIYHRITSYHKI